MTYTNSGAETANFRPRNICLAGAYRKCLEWLACTAFLSFCFPYLTPVRSSTDLQPYSLFLAVALLVLAAAKPGLNVKIVKSLALLFVPAAYSLLISMAYAGFELRSVAGYFCLAIYGCAGYTIAKERLVGPKLIYWAIAVWGIAAILETVVSGKLFSFILPRVSTTAGRGVVGLAPEPFHYGATILLLFILLRLLYLKGLVSRNCYLWCFIGIIAQVLFLAKSATIALFFVVYGGLEAIFPVTVKKIALASVLITSMYFLIISIHGEMSDIRIVAIAKALIDDPRLLLLGDASVNDRVTHVVVSLYGFWTSLPFAFGHGTTAWGTFLQQTLFNHFPSLSEASQGNRIMSGYGACLFELGYIGLMIPAVQIFSFSMQKEKGMVVLGIFLAICMFHIVPIAHPLFGFILGTSECLRRTCAQTGQYSERSATELRLPAAFVAPSQSI
ncbi:MAG: hypothetical protein ACRD28_01385 [Acidobacteriaceae bacterium]